MPKLIASLSRYTWLYANKAWLYLSLSCCRAAWTPAMLATASGAKAGSTALAGSLALAA
jgi:hypothetical protein